MKFVSIIVVVLEQTIELYLYLPIVISVLLWYQYAGGKN